MSSRVYPLYQKGNPQLRIFLPNFWMKLIKNHENLTPSNHVTFHVSMGMSANDVKNYLEKLYKIPVVNVRCFIKMGPTKEITDRRIVVKDDDLKYAIVRLPKGTTFEYPNLFPEEKEKKSDEEAEKNKKMIQESMVKLERVNKLRPDVPKWLA